MATKMERLQSVLNLLKNTDDITLNETRRVAAGFAAEFAAGRELTNPQQAGLTMQAIKEFIGRTTRAGNIKAAERQAAIQAEAKSTIDLGGSEEE